MISDINFSDTTFHPSVDAGDATFELRDKNQKTLATLKGYLTSGWILVQHVEVPEYLRGRGAGQHMLRQLEDFAAARNCVTIHVNLYEFSAQKFFEKQGYRVLPFDLRSQGDVARVYLQKQLPAAFEKLLEAA